MTADLTLNVLQAVSHPIRKSIVESLGLNKEPRTFSDIMWDSGLNPNFDTGPFWYHLSYLIEIGIILKDDDKYGLSQFGSEVYKILRILIRECSFLLKPTFKEVKKKVNKSLQTRWAKEEDMEGFRLTRQVTIPEPQVIGKDESVKSKFDNWKGPNPALTLDSLYGAPLVVERDGKPVVMLWIRKEARYKLIDTEYLGGKHWKGKRKEEFWLFITRVWTWPSTDKKEAIAQVLEYLFCEAKEYNINVIEAADVRGDDKTVTKKIQRTRI